MIAQGDFKNGLITAIKGIMNIIIGILNVVIEGINALISPIRGLIVSAGKITGNNWTMDDIKIPTIPKLAQGGIISKPTQALIGEAGKEAVIPLENNTEWMDILADRIVQSMSGWKISAEGKGNWNQFIKFMNLELTKGQKRQGTNLIGGTTNG